MARGDNTIGRNLKEALYGIEHRLFEDEPGKALLRIFASGVADKRIQEMIHYRVQQHQFMREMDRNPFRPPRPTKGEIFFGLDQQGCEIRVPVQGFNAHELTVAGSGAGKTNRGRIMAMQIAPHVEGMWLFDLRKREWRVLRPCFSHLGAPPAVVSGRSMKLNPLQVPKGVVPAEWAAQVSDLLVMVLTLPRRAGKLIQSVVIKLYREMGVYDGSCTYPTLFHLYDAIKAQRQANPQARASVLDNLEPVLLSLGPSVLAYHVGWSTGDLSRRHLIFELAGLTEVDKNLILASLLVGEFSSRISRGISNPRMDLWINFDEAQRLCSASRGSTEQGGVIADLIGLVRGTGIGLSLSVQSAHDLLPSVVSNCATKVLGRCGADSDYSAIARAVGMLKEERRWLTTNLRPGAFAGSLGEGARQPFIFHLPYFDPRAFAATDPAATSTSTTNDNALASIPVVPAACPKLLT